LGCDKTTPSKGNSPSRFRRIEKEILKLYPHFFSLPMILKGPMSLGVSLPHTLKHHKPHIGDALRYM
jgi:hypothetical protein